MIDNDNTNDIERRLDAISKKEATQLQSSPHRPGAAERERQSEENWEQVRRDAAPTLNDKQHSRGNSTKHADNVTVDFSDSGEIEPHRDRESRVPFPLEALPLVTRNYVINTARALNVDPAIVAVSVLTAAGATFGARLKLRLGGYDWAAAPILWIGIVGASSLGKSPAMKAPMTLLRDKERELTQRHAEEMEEYNRTNRIYKKILDKIDKYHENAIDKEEEGDEEAAEALREKAANLEQSPHFKAPQKPAERVLKISGDFSLPGLVGIAAENEMGFMLHLDEMTQLFSSLSNSSDNGAAQEFLKFFDGTPSRTGYKNAEKNRTAAQCWASILGGAVPSILQSYLRGTQYEKDGLLSRFCLVWAPPIPPEQFDPRAEMTDEQMAPMKKVMEALVDFRPDFYMEGDEGVEEEADPQSRDEMYQTPKSRYCRLSPEALEEFCKKRADLYNDKVNSGQGAQMSLLGKSDGVLGRICLILHVLEAVERWIDETQRELSFPFGLESYVEAHEVSLETYRRAEQISEWLIHETEVVYKRMGILEDDGDLRFIVDRLKKRTEGANESTIRHWRYAWRDKTGKLKLERLLTLGVKRGLWTATAQDGGNNRDCLIYRATEK